MSRSASADVYVDQSAAELRLTVCEGDLDLEQFNLLEQGSLLNTSVFNVNAAIIGASHVLRFTLPDDSQLNEVFACVEVRTRNRKLVTPSELRPQKLKLTLPSAVYTFSSRVERGEGGFEESAEFESVVREARRDNALGLAHNFPKKPSNRWVPKTLVRVRRLGQKFEVETVHSYPNEEVNVFTRTTLRLTNAKEKS